MRRIRSYLAALGAALLVSGVALSQQTVTPSGIYDMVRNTITAQVALVSQGTLAVTGTSAFTGAITATGGVVGAVTGGITGNVVGNVTGNVTGDLTGNSTGTHTGAVVATTVSASGAITPTGGVAAAGGFTVSPRLINTGGYPAIAAGSGNNSTPSTTETYNTEICIPASMTIAGVALFNGDNVTGNVTVGLATSAGAPITAAKSASTAGSGTDAYQRVPFAVAYAAKGPACYFIQAQYDSATARYNTHTVGNFGCLVQTAQTYGTFASFTAPSTFVTNVCNMAALY